MPGKITAGQKCRLLVTVPSPPASGKTNCKAIRGVVRFQLATFNPVPEGVV